VLQLVDFEGDVHYFYTDLRFEVVNVPACGQLFMWDSAAANISAEIVAQPGSQRQLNKCDTNSREYVTASANTFDGRQSLLYVPREGFIGDDLFRVRRWDSGASHRQRQPWA